MKKKLIIFLVFLIIFSLTGVACYYIYQKNKPENVLEIEWVRLYYDFLNKNNEEIENSDDPLKSYHENEKIQFCKLNDNDIPVLLFSFEELGQTYINVYYINKHKVNNLNHFSKKADIKCLYSFDEHGFDYYIYYLNGNEEIYIKLKDVIDAEINEKFSINQEDDVYSDIEKCIFKQNDKYTFTTLSGEVIEVLKFDEKFVLLDIVENGWNDIDFNTYEEKIKKDFVTSVNSIKEELDKEEKDVIMKKENEINEKKEQIIKAKEEIEQKIREEAERKRQEEERKKQEEEAKKKAEEEAKKIEEEAKRLAEEQLKEKEAEAKRKEEEAKKSGQIKVR